MSIRVTVNGNDYRNLVAGRVAHVVGYDQNTQANVNVELLLADIGWDKMIQAIIDAKNRMHNSPAEDITKPEPPYGDYIEGGERHHIHCACGKCKE